MLNEFDTWFSDFESDDSETVINIMKKMGGEFRSLFKKTDEELGIGKNGDSGQSRKHIKEMLNQFGKRVQETFPDDDLKFEF